MSDQPTTPAPGSHEARRNGCRCSGPQNGYGRGAFVSTGGDVQYLIDPKCPMHAMIAPKAK